MSEEDRRIFQGTRTDWFLHELANSLGLLNFYNFETDDETLAGSKKILEIFMENMDRKDLDIPDQGPFSDERMRSEIKRFLGGKWDESGQRKKYKRYQKLVKEYEGWVDNQQ